MSEDFQLNFRGRRVVPPLPPGICAAIREFGAEERPEGVEADSSSAASMYIAYRDRNGAASRRRITVKSLAGYFGELEYLFAVCHECNELRQFNIAGIDELICPHTGEVFDPKERCLALQASGALGIKDMVLTDLARLVVFMALCDGELHPLEVSALDDVFGRYVRFFGGDDATLEHVCAHAKRLSPDGDDVRKALWHIKRAPEGRAVSRFVLDSCGTIVAADGRQDDEEFRWGIELSDALRKIAERT